MKLSSSVKAVIFIGAAVVLLQAGSLAQFASPRRTSGKLEGVVVDVNDARVANASVTIAGKRLKREVVSDEEGKFRIELPAGTYQFTVYSPGFAVFRGKDVKVQADFTTSLEIPLKVAAVGPCSDDKSIDKGIVICM